jgi:hypothetical protein
VTSDDITFITNFVKIGLLVRTEMGGPYGHHGYVINFTCNPESRKIR